MEVAVMTGTGSRLQGHRVRLLRDDLKLTQDDLGTMIGVPGKQIIRYEKNQTDPSSEIIAALAKALNTNADYLLGLSEDSSPKAGELTSRERRIIDQFRRGEYSTLVSELISEATQGNPNQPPPAKGKTALDH
jgi:transcriptional regulator with XRE-family HTH domain